MKKFYSGVVKCQKAILTIFFLLAVVCIFLQQMIAVNYDINDYLPEDSSSTISLDVMSEEFEGGIPNARAMIRNVTIPEALEYKEQLLRARDPLCGQCPMKDFCRHYGEAHTKKAGS